jgi:hypothetical protein
MPVKSTDRHPPLLAIILAFMIAVAGLVAMAPTAFAASVYRADYKAQFAGAYTPQYTGCILTYTDVQAGRASDGATYMSYTTASQDLCSGEWFYYLYGTAPTTAFTFSASSVHAVATVPLNDLSAISLDLTWRATGPAYKWTSSFRQSLPGDYLYKSSGRGQSRPATMTGTLSSDNGYIAASRDTYLSVSIGTP